MGGVTRLWGQWTLCPFILSLSWTKKRGVPASKHIPTPPSLFQTLEELDSGCRGQFFPIGVPLILLQ